MKSVTHNLVVQCAEGRVFKCILLLRAEPESNEIGCEAEDLRFLFIHRLFVADEPMPG